MALLITTNRLALGLLLTDDIYKVDDPALADVKHDELPAGQVVIEQAPAYIYLGKNKLNTLLVIDNAANEYLDDACMDALVKTLGAKRQSIDDVALLNLSRNEAAQYEPMKTHFAFKNLVLFGIKPSRIGLPDIPVNKITAQGDVRILVTHTLNEMLDNKEMKKNFWQEMKLL
ncbi:hypothetical protein FW774_00760 (plasmid) [Pedobacter sp. BS3]|uniref:hypothetical protein n=1 Tax=Pedobacter sp. BS3 TaxID=2567937 RepID=UPI0011ECFA46|nr:hypothetical protein [Pedobacter sp. BS3]TZF85641.1 hypothetical protein FW774_00760 [Pedobacter sp. BS3]